MTEMFMNDDEEVVHLARVPHIITSETIVTSCAPNTPSTSGARIQASAAAIELGRKLLLASRSGDTQAVLDLMAKGAPFTTDWLGTCPLHLAASNNHAATCAVLLRAGAGRDARTKVERTPLHLAAAHGHLDAARLLLAYGANVHCRDMLRMTPLHWAAQRGHAALVALLLRHGADARLRDKFHKTPAALAAASGADELAALLADSARRPVVYENVDKPEEKEKEEEYETVEEVEEDAIPMETEDDPVTDIKIENQQDASRAGARLLRAHGITLLAPHDVRPPLLAAIDCGRTLVLSDAGKLMLKESEEAMPAPATKPTSPLKVTVNQKEVILTPTSQRSVVTNAANQKGVVLTATPVKTPPKPGVKIFTINDKLTLSKENVKMPVVRKGTNAQDVQLKLVQVPSDGKVSPALTTPMKAKVRLSGKSPATPVTVASNHGKPLVKIIMNKNNYNKLIATANKATASTADTTLAASEQSTVVVPEQFVRSQSARFLRSQLLAAHAKLHALHQQLQHYRTRLQRYEHVT